MSRRLTDDQGVRFVQARLIALGLLDGPVDGAFWDATIAAFDAALPAPPAAAMPPWVEVAREALGWHEVHDNAKLAAWLKRDGSTLGNPARLPWCGDAAVTALRIGLPGEPFPGPLGENPYWALNWLHFGRRLGTPGLGCVAVKSRKGGGHVTFVVGRYPNGDLACLGGNQGNRMSIAAYPESAFEGFRFPKTWPHEPLPLPLMEPGGALRLPGEA